MTVVSHESEGLIRVAENLMENFDVDTNSLDHNAKITNLPLKHKINSSLMMIHWAAVAHVTKNKSLLNS